METLNTVIEFVDAGCSWGSDNPVSSSLSATSDPLTFISIALAILAAGAAFLLCVYNKKLSTAQKNPLHTIHTDAAHDGSLNNKALIAAFATVCIICAAAFFSVLSHNNAFASDNEVINGDLATITKTVNANVVDSGIESVDKATISNKDKNFAIGIRQVKSSVESDVDLSDINLQIKCKDVEIYNKTLGSTQLNDEYVAVKVDNSADLEFSLKMPAETAKHLIGKQPIILSTVVDLVVSKPGKVTSAAANTGDTLASENTRDSLAAENIGDSLGAGIPNAEIRYTYKDPYDESKLVSGLVYSDSNGDYVISNVWRGATADVTVKYTDPATKHLYEYTQQVEFNDEEAIPSVVPKTQPKVSDLVFVSPFSDPEASNAYDGQTKIASFTASDTCPEGMLGSVTVKYSTDGDTWTANPPKDAGKYYVCADIDGTGKNWNDATLIDKDRWTFTINKATLTITPTEGLYKVYDGAIVPASAITYSSQGAISGEVPSFSGGLKLEGDPAPVNAGVYNIVNDNLSLQDNTPFLAANYSLSFTEGITYQIRKKTDGVKIVLSETEGTCDAKYSIKFSASDPTGFGSETPTECKVESSDTGKATATISLVSELKWEIVATGVSAGSANISVTIESTNYSATSVYALTVLSYRQIRQVTNISYNSQSVNFVPAFSDTDNKYLSNNRVEYFTDSNCQEPDTEINSLIQSGCTMNELCGKLKKDGAVKNLWVKANVDVVFYGVLSAAWYDVFDKGEYYIEHSAANYKRGTTFHNNFLNDDNGIGTVYFTGSKWGEHIATDTNWTKGQGDCPTLNGVSFSDKDNPTSAFFGAYGASEGGILSYQSIVYSSYILGDLSQAYIWNPTESQWEAYSCSTGGGIVVSLSFSKLS